MRLYGNSTTSASYYKKLRTNLLFIMTFLVSCTEVPKPKENIFFISNTYKLKIDSIVKGLSNELPPPPLPPFYMYYHFLVDTSGQMFYYQFGQRGRPNRSGEGHVIPDFIGLKPNDLVQIPGSSVKEFLKINILNQDSSYRIVTVGLLKDTIISDALADLRDVIQAESNKAKWYLREATLEERVVLAYKMQQKDYNPENVKWDSTKINYPTTMIRFSH